MFKYILYLQKYKPARTLRFNKVTGSNYNIWLNMRSLIFKRYKQNVILLIQTFSHIKIIYVCTSIALLIVSFMLQVLSHPGCLYRYKCQAANPTCLNTGRGYSEGREECRETDVTSCPFSAARRSSSAVFHYTTEK